MEVGAVGTAIMGYFRRVTGEAGSLLSAQDWSALRTYLLDKSTAWINGGNLLGTRLEMASSPSKRYLLRGLSDRCV